MPVEIVEKQEASSPNSDTETSILEIELVSGHRLRLISGYDADALARLIRELSA